MSYQARHPAAFINALTEGPKASAIEWLQRIWDDYTDAVTALQVVRMSAAWHHLMPETQKLIDDALDTTKSKS